MLLQRGLRRERGRVQVPLKPWMHNAVTLLLVACALVVTAVVVARAWDARGNTGPAPLRVAGWKTLVDGRPPAIGEPGARKTLVVFSDFECPFCRDLDSKLVALDKQHPGRFSVIRYELPLVRIHASAMQASIASKCAARTAEYARFNALLLERGNELDRVDYRRLARTAGMADIDGFQACLVSPQARAEVEADLEAAAKFGFDATPTLVVDGLAYSGTMEMRALVELID